MSQLPTCPIVKLYLVLSTFILFSKLFFSRQKEGSNVIDGWTYTFFWTKSENTIELYDPVGGLGFEKIVRSWWNVRDDLTEITGTKIESFDSKLAVNLETLNILVLYKIVFVNCLSRRRSGSKDRWQWSSAQQFEKMVLFFTSKNAHKNSQNSSFLIFRFETIRIVHSNCPCGPGILVDSGLFRIYFCSIYWKWKIPGIWPKVHWLDKVICLGWSDRWNWKSERDGNLVRQTELTQLFFGFKSDHVAKLPTTSDQPRPVYGQSTTKVRPCGHQ